MKNIDGLLESECVDRPVCIPSVVLHDFKNAWSLACPSFGTWVLASELCRLKGVYGTFTELLLT
jgi:hypothetical protein